MRGELSVERDRYRSAAQRAERALSEAGGKPEPVGQMAKVGMWLGTQMNTRRTSNAHIAEMVIQGATMGVIEVIKARNTYPDAGSSRGHRESIHRDAKRHH